LLVVFLAELPAQGQDHELRGLQLAEPADVRPYGNWAQPKTGFFFDFEGIFWTISPPKVTTVGFPGLTREVFTGPTTAFETTETNTMETNFRAKWKQGDRIQLGYQGEHHGWLVETIETNTQTQHLAGQHVSVVFDDPVNAAGNQLLTGNVGTDINGNIVIANVPINFYTLQTTNRTALQGVEAAYVYRAHQLHRGATLEWMLGARYFYLYDDFQAVGYGGFQGPTPTLASTQFDSQWDNTVRNRVVGPQLGLRYVHPVGRCSLSAEGRFMAGLNAQAVHLTGGLAASLTNPPNTALLQPELMRATAFDHSANFYEFAPLAELRVEAHVQITRLIQAKVGWTGFWMNGIGRASNMIEYTVPDLQITKGIGFHGYRQDLFVQGLTLGIELNR